MSTENQPPASPESSVPQGQTSGTVLYRQPYYWLGKIQAKVIHIRERVDGKRPSALPIEKEVTGCLEDIHSLLELLVHATPINQQVQELEAERNEIVASMVKIAKASGLDDTWGTCPSEMMVQPIDQRDEALKRVQELEATVVALRWGVNQAIHLIEHNGQAALAHATLVQLLASHDPGERVQGVVDATVKWVEDGCPSPSGWRPLIEAVRAWKDSK